MPESTHDLLLALAGRVDDDLLAWARELVAIGEEGQAVDLLTATLIADRVALPAAVRAALVDAGRLSRAGLGADRALPAAAGGDVCEHRFGGDAPDADAAHRLTAALPAERLRACRVLLAWRLTPAGTAPGPLPQPVVLVESEGSAGLREVLAYQVAAALERARTPAAVEVFDAGAPLPAYHAAALDVARPIALGQDAGGGRTVPRPASGAPWDRAARDDADPRRASADERAGQDTGRRGQDAGRRAAPDTPAPEPTGTRAPAWTGQSAESAEAAEATEAAAGARSGERPGAERPPARPGAHPVADPAAADHVADDRERRGAEPDRPAARSGTAAAAGTQAEPPTSPGQHPAGRPPVGRRAGDGPDPLSGPLRQPLLEPLLDPTIRPDDPLGLGTGPLAPGPSAASADDGWFSNGWAAPAGRPTTPPSPPPSEASDGPLSRRRRTAEPADDPPPVTPPAGAPSQATPSAGTPSPATPPPRPARRNRYRPDDEAAPPPDRPAPPSDPGPRPESLAALSDTERDLLAQLQAELAAREGRPRVSRRAGIAGSPSTNGNGNGNNPRPRPDTA